MVLLSVATLFALSGPAEATPRAPRAVVVVRITAPGPNGSTVITEARDYSSQADCAIVTMYKGGVLTVLADTCPAQIPRRPHY